MKHLLLALLGIILLSGCTMTPDQNTSVTTTPPLNTSTATVAPISTIESQIQSITPRIRDNAEFMNCMKGSVNMCVHSTVLQLGQKTADISLCKELGSHDQQQNCEWTIMMLQAQEKKDATLCENIPDANYRQNCAINIYRIQAQETKDVTLCKKIGELLVTSTGTWQMAPIPSSMEEDNCTSMLIINNPKSAQSDCNAVKDINIRTMCKNTLESRTYAAPLPDPISPKK